MEVNMEAQKKAFDYMTRIYTYSESNREAVMNSGKGQVSRLDPYFIKISSVMCECQTTEERSQNDLDDLVQSDYTREALILLVQR